MENPEIPERCELEGHAEPAYINRVEAALELALESELEHVHDLEASVMMKQRFARLLTAAYPLARLYAESREPGGPSLCVPRELLDALTRATAEVVGI
jgi:hypothetical protein